MVGNFRKNKNVSDKFLLQYLLHYPADFLHDVPAGHSHFFVASCFLVGAISSKQDLVPGSVGRFIGFIRSGSGNSKSAVLAMACLLQWPIQDWSSESLTDLQHWSGQVLAQDTGLIYIVVTCLYIQGTNPGFQSEEVLTGSLGRFTGFIRFSSFKLRMATFVAAHGMFVKSANPRFGPRDLWAGFAWSGCCSRSTDLVCDVSVAVAPCSHRMRSTSQKRTGQKMGRILCEWDLSVRWASGSPGRLIGFSRSGLSEDAGTGVMGAQTQKIRPIPPVLAGP